MLTATEAERLIFTLVEPVRAVEGVPLADCLGRVLAEPVRSGLDFPHWDNSAMDGYAVRAADVARVPVTLDVVGEIPAGTRPERVVGEGQAMRILTGAMMPEGADAVVMQEETEIVGASGGVGVSGEVDASGGAGYKPALTGERVTVLVGVERGASVRSQGSYCRAGAEILAAGRAIAPAEVALLAAAQQMEVKVFRRPRVAIISTGSELVEPGQSLGPGQIVDSNQYALAALVAQAGAVPVPLGIVPDEREQVKGAIARALAQADMVLSSGGVSVGDYDYVDAVLEELGATLHIRSVAVKPGKPLTVAAYSSRSAKRYDYAQPSVNAQPSVAVPSLESDQFLGSSELSGVGQQLYFGLPGNPASAMVGFWRFVAPAIQRLSGLVEPPSVTFVWAKTLSELTAGGKRETYLWGQLRARESGYEFARAAGGHSSGNLVNLANTSGLAVVPMGETRIAAGESVRVLVCKANI